MIPDLVADVLDLGVGDDIVFPSKRGTPVTLPVAGIYRSLFKGTPNGYWLVAIPERQVGDPHLDLHRLVIQMTGGVPRRVQVMGRLSS